MTDTVTNVLAGAFIGVSSTLFAAALTLALRNRRNNTRRPTQPITLTQIVNPPANNGIPVEQQPRIIAPILRRPIPIHNLVGDEEEIVSESTTPVIPERRPPTSPRRHTPIITLSPTGFTNSTPYAPRSPSPSEYAQYIWEGRGFDVGCDIRPHTPHDDPYNRAWDDDAPPRSAPVSPSEFWNNITIPYSAYFPSNSGSPDHQTPPPAGYKNVRFWDQPVQNQELTPEPIPTIEEPVASSSRLSPDTASYWQNINKQRLAPLHLRTIREIDEDAATYHLNWFGETQGHSWGSESSDTITHELPEAIGINGIHGNSPAGSSELPSVPTLHPTNPDSPHGSTN